MNGLIRTLLLSACFGLSIFGACAQFIQNHYQRPSLTQIMIEHPMNLFNSEIKEVYKSIPISNRFNNHDLGVKTIKLATDIFTDQTPAINTFIKKSKVGSRAVAKWFGWDKTTGKFTIDLIRKRGLYDASALERDLARHQVLGAATLEDAGENLIPRTFLIMHDIAYNGNYNTQREMLNQTGHRVTFSVEVTSYIYSLDWNVDSLERFYACYYTPGNKNFINESNYSYTFRAKVTSKYEETESKLTQSELMKQVIARCLDMNIAKLQTAYNPFRIVAPLLFTDPLLADVGLKEGITSNTKFEVLEPEINAEGIVKYNRVGIIKPRSNKIVDIRFTIYERPDAADEQYTEFEIVRGTDFDSGLLIREY